MFKAPLLVLGALLSTSAYPAVTQAQFIVNAYYGDTPATTQLSSLISSGATSHLTHLTYAFAGSDGNSNPCTSAPAAMNATDLKNLKAQNPNVKILISVGGENSGPVFTNALKQSASTFASSCVNTLMGSFPGYVDGIDIDWEFPESGTDEQNFNALLAAFRTALDTYAQQNNITEHLLLTAAIGPEDTTNGWEFIDFTGATYAPGANSSVDFYNVEFYNYAYGPDGVTESDAPIHDINNDIFGNPNAYGAAGLIPVGGVPASKIVVGIPFYGVHYTGVTNGTQLGQPGTLDPSANGTPPYYQIVNILSGGGYTNYSDTDGSAWSWNSSSGDFYEYDNGNTIGQKTTYAQSNQLGGIFAWNLQDDTTTGTLLSATPAPPTAPYTNVTGSVSVTALTGMAYNRLKHTGSEVLSIMNTSGQTINGPIQLVLSGLPEGVTPTNNTGTFNGNPYWMVTANSITPGSAVEVTITLSYTGSFSITTTPTVYSGNF